METKLDQLIRGIEAVLVGDQESVYVGICPKTETVRRNIREVFDRYVAPESWEQKVEIMREFIASQGLCLNPPLTAEQAEDYAIYYQEMILSFVMRIQRTISIFRRV